jgi:glycosyltransferase involved in cell wall biosynthesis
MHTETLAVKCSIVIRSYNEDRHIGRLLTGIAVQTVQPLEVILVDSGSIDRTIEIAESMGARIVRIDKREFTFGRALNIGCAAAKGDILVFASAHVYPTYDNWLETLLVPFADERVILSYGRQRGNESTKFSESQIFAKWFPKGSVCPQRSYFCNNANCAVRRDAWLDQPYDETLPGLEDLAWAKLAQAKGRWIAYQGGAEIIHVHDETWIRVRDRYRREAMAMRRIDEHARFSFMDFLRLLAGNVLSDLRVAWRRGVLRQELASILMFRANQKWGTYRGYNGPPDMTAELRRRFYFPVGVMDGEDALPELESRRIDYESLDSQGRASSGKRLKVVSSS